MNRLVIKGVGKRNVGNHVHDSDDVGIIKVVLFEVGPEFLLCLVNVGNQLLVDRVVKVGRSNWHKGIHTFPNRNLFGHLNDPIDMVHPVARAIFTQLLDRIALYSSNLLFVIHSRLLLLFN